MHEQQQSVLWRLRRRRGASRRPKSLQTGRYEAILSGSVSSATPQMQTTHPDSIHGRESLVEHATCPSRFWLL